MPESFKTKLTVIAQQLEISQNEKKLKIARQELQKQAQETFEALPPPDSLFSSQNALTNQFSTPIMTGGESANNPPPVEVTPASNNNPTTVGKSVTANFHKI